jgi:hypothetical protein
MLGSCPLYDYQVKVGKKVKMKGDANRSKIEKANPCLPKKL